MMTFKDDEHVFFFFLGEQHAAVSHLKLKTTLATQNMTSGLSALQLCGLSDCGMSLCSLKQIKGGLSGVWGLEYDLHIISM